MANESSSANHQHTNHAFSSAQSSPERVLPGAYHGGVTTSLSDQSPHRPYQVCRPLSTHTSPHPRPHNHPHHNHHNHNFLPPSRATAGQEVSSDSRHFSVDRRDLSRDINQSSWEDARARHAQAENEAHTVRPRAFPKEPPTPSTNFRLPPPYKKSLARELKLEEEEEEEEEGEYENEGRMKEEEERGGMRSPMVWDSGFGGYVPRSSVVQPKVYIRVVFLKIGEIDTLKEQFRAEVFVQARWREPRLDHCHNVEEVQWDDLWNPQLQLENAMDDPQSSVWYDLSFSPDRHAYVLEKRRVKADFAETLELQNFPFDMQHLSVMITSQLSDARLELLEDEEELSSVNLLSFVDEQEWNVRDIVEALPEVRCREFSQLKHKFPMITVRTYAIRRAGFFVWNVLAIMVLICSLSLCTFSVDRKLPQNRLQLSFTLVLTGIAFKFVVGQSLPKISYLTVLDKYILGSMILMHVISVWHAVITRFKDHPSLADTMDDWAFIVFIVVFFSYNVGYAVVMLVKTYMKRTFIGVLEADYQAKVQRLMKEGQDTTHRKQVMKKGRQKHHKNANHARVHVAFHP